MGYNDCVAKISKVENGWSIEIKEEEEPSKGGMEHTMPEMDTYIATTWADVIKILNAKVSGKGAEEDYSEAFKQADED